MARQTKRIKKNRNRNKSKRYYGGEGDDVKEEGSKGIFDTLGNTLSSYTGKAKNYIKEKGLRLVGLQPINPVEEEKVEDGIVDQNINEISNTAAGLATSIGSDITNVVDKGSSAVIGNINDVLESPKVGQTLNDAAAETAEIGQKLLENFNEKLNTPEFKEEAKEALDNAADYAEIAVDALDKPLNKAIDTLNEAGTKAVSGTVSGAIKVTTDAMAAVPGAGAIIELGKMANDVTAAAGDVVEAASDASSAISKVVEETSSNMEEGLDKLEQQKKEGMKIGERTNESIHSFENPISTSSGGGRKTRKRFLKRKAKSKRVRFAI